MSASWLQNIIQKSALEMELGGKTIFQFSQSTQQTLAKYPVQEWEANAWARGLKIGLIRLEGYYFRVGSGKRSPLSFFIRNDQDLYVGLRRESVTQAATYVHLITDYGYSRQQVHFESRWMDVAVYDEKGEAWIYAENKSSDKVLQKLCGRLATEFAEGLPPQDPEATRIDDAVMKAHHIWKNRPPYFLGVSPQSKRSYRVSYARRGFTLESSSQLPTALEWEFPATV